MTFEIFKDRKKQYRFRIKAGNGQVIIPSEDYKNKGNVKRRYKFFKKHFPDLKLKDLTV